METPITEPRPSDPSTSTQLLETPSGTSYIPLNTGSSTPIFLTPYYRTDAPILQVTLSNPMITAHLVSVPQPYTLADAEFWINLQLDGTDILPLQVIRASNPESGHLIGSASLMAPDSEVSLVLRDKIPEAKGLKNAREYEVAYYLHPDWRGKGIMNAAVRALMDWGKKSYGVSAIVRVAEQNVASRKVVESFKEFVRDEKRDGWMDWPEVKGGGKRKLLLWKWEG